MTLIAFVLLCVGGAVLWWKLSIVQEQNAQLRAELLRLRGKLRTR